MYSIGEFSRINMITTKTLRHYDKIGLITPARTDSWTGYRYYSPDQLAEIRKILELRDLGFSLEEIKRILHGGVDLRTVMKDRAESLEQSISENKRRLQAVYDVIRDLDEGEKMKYSVELKNLPEVIVAAMRTIVPDYDAYFDVVPKMGAYMHSVGAVCREPAYCFTIYHDGEYKEQDIDVEICEAVTAPCEESERVKFKTVKSVQTAACLYHKGPYSTLRTTYQELFTWIEENGFDVIDNARESYIHGIWDHEDPEQWLTEVQVPVTMRG